jgi:cyclic beta-1,2-glucan synthetase
LKGGLAGAMKAKPVRIVLAFYSADEGPTDLVWKSLQRIARVCTVRPDSRNIPAFFRRYALLRMEGEAMLMAETQPSNVETVVKTLQLAGSPAIFAVNPDIVFAADGESIVDSASESTSAALTRKMMLARLRKYKSALESARQDLAQATRLERALSPAAAWILDNTYLIYTQINEVERHLPRDYSAWANSHNGHGDINAVAHGLVSGADYVVTEASIRECLKESQTASPFTIAELWAFPLFLRLALIKELTEIATRVNRSQQLRESAYLWANRLASSARAGAGVFQTMLGHLETEPTARQAHFITALAEQLHDEELALGPAQQWIEERFGKSLMEVVRAQHTREAAETVSTSNAFGSLRTLAQLDFKTIFEDVSLVEAELRKDPAGTYPLSDFQTRDRSRRVVEKVSGHSGLEEREVARRAVQLALGALESGTSSDPRTAHVAYYLLSGGLAHLEAETRAHIPLGTNVLRAASRHATPVYLSIVVALTACFTVLSWLLAREAGVQHIAILAALTALAIFPLSELCIQIVNALVISLLPADPLPKLDFKNGIPAAHATLVVVPMMLTGHEVIRAEIQKLEVRFLGNRNENIFYSLFPDFTDFPESSAPDDEELLQAAREAIADLNRRYPPAPGVDGDRFLLFHRPRVWSESEQGWIGRERKRGKLEELNAFLCGDGREEILDTGHLPLPVSYVITLDSDTQLPADAARRLIETIAHPLNKVEIDPATRTRREGYTIIQPRVSITLPGAMATRFTRIFADATGTDPYSRTVSDAQQDLFLEAIFHGKAIYDVRAFHDVVGNRFPAETLLSHDLIEGAHVGVGLATDIQLFEHLPVDYGSFAARQHRWIRGDWQIARWTLGRVPSASGALEPNPLSIINRWRILDNLRRSLVPVAALLLLLLGWLTKAAPGVWSLVVGLAVAIPAMTPLLDRLARKVQGSVHRWQGAADELIRALVMISFLPHQAWLAVDAIARVYYRSRISRRKLLEWRTADHARVEAHHHRNATFRQLVVISALSAPLTIGLLIEGEFAPTSFFVIVWALSPLLMQWMGRPARSLARKELSGTETHFLRGMARETWRYFDDLVGPESNWLPPDNCQLALRVEVAQRTSPTNIGLWFTSALAARDFGYLTSDEFCLRCSNTMETLSRMEHYEGHLLNWYDTRTLEPLNPRYVSTVDSGNLIAALWVLQQGCNDALRAPVIGQMGLRGLSGTLSILEGKCGDDPSAVVALHALRRLVRGSKEGHELIGRYRMALAPMQKLRESQRWHVSATDERSYWASRLSAELASWTNVADRYLPWMETLASPPDSSLFAIGQDAVKLRRRALHQMPSLAELSGANHSATLVDEILTWRSHRELRPELAAWLDQLAAQYAAARANATEAVARLQALSADASKLADGINMRFLYDAGRRLFGVGYAVGGPREFNSHYDLLASECRLTSMVAIAKGDLPVDHWFALNRAYAYSSRGQILLSWSGTMFEYLMPLLFTRSFANSVLDQGCRDAVQRQIAYGHNNGIPWGISESAWSALDSHQIYQYRAFGVPSLALNPTTEEERVVSPYSSMLALQVDPAAATENLERLKNLGLAGPMGLYESIDFSRESQKDGARGVVIYCYMAHHQGMSLAALDNVLHRGVMQRRFHGDLRIRAVESLLFESIPVERLPIAEAETRPAPIHMASTEEIADRLWTEETAAPRVHLQGNGRYALMITNSGGGYSRWKDFDVTRWRSDTTLDPWGSFIYIRDLKSDDVWATSHKPFPAGDGEITVHFASDRAEIHRRVAGIETILEITVASEDDVELRRVKITNRSLRTRQLEFTSYAELAMIAHAADASHPAFAKMFVETESPEAGVLIAHRRPRSPGEAAIWTAHILVPALLGSPVSGLGKLTRSDGIQFETDRAKFLGRGNSTENPAALRNRLTGSAGTVIDPIFSLRCRITLDPRERQELAFLTMAAPSREELLRMVAKYNAPGAVSRAFEMAWTRAQLEFRFLRIGPGAAHRFQELASQMIYPSAKLRPPIDRLFRNRLGQEGLWAYGISGDLPMLVVTLSDARNVSLVREVLLAQAYWRLRGFRADVIILNQEAPSYDAPLRLEILRQIHAHASDAGVDRPGGVFLRDWHAIPEEHRALILASASIVLNGNRGSLQQQLVTAAEGLPLAPFVPAGGGPEEPSRPLPFLELPYFNGLGGFTPDGREYAIYLKPGATTPAPWVNVMANANFGTMVSESGLGFTWSGNSQANRLTPWHNDPVSDPQSEVIYLRDDESGAVWTPVALPRREKDAYRARHGQGYTVFEHNSHAIGLELTVFVPVAGNGSGDPVKVCRLRLRNDSSHKRRLTLTWFVEWTLGSTREDQQIHIQSSRDEESGALLARQYWNESSRGHWAFAASHPKASSWSCDRGQFLGRDGSRSNPAALDHVRLDNRVGTGADPCAAQQISVSLERGQQKEVVFLLGQAGSIEDVRAIVKRLQSPEDVEKMLAATRGWWDSTLGSLQVKTPILSIDFLLNRWLLYQSLSCRFWGRSALYQSAGAFGFRDQLQDSMAFVYAAPQLTRQHILAAAARQFAEGDVQHWWHPDTGMGVRTRCSDDLLWLPFTVAQYVKVTNDTGILDEEMPFVEGPPLGQDEHERMFTPTVSAATAPLLEHCKRALDCGFKLGRHSLPLMGDGDWNDGMNLVGAEGRGESVWLGWFLCTVLESYADLLENRTDAAEAAGTASKWRGHATALKAALEHSGWDGDWYLRAYFDNGSTLGSHVNEEARIDSLPQSWAVISGAADPARAGRAMESAEANLVRERDRLVLLFTPPFDHSEPNPGYIMGYPPGMRENGGQYTHGSLWMAMAWARLREGRKAVRLLQMMNPIESNRGPAEVARYHGEPYVTAGDVYAASGRIGQSGWTWYTGSAAWMYRIWIEEVLGFRLRGDRFTVEPSLPADWPGFELTYRHGSTVYEIKATRHEDGSAALELDGEAVYFIPLDDTGRTHSVTVRLINPTVAEPMPVQNVRTPFAELLLTAPE